MFFSKFGKFGGSREYPVSKPPNFFNSKNMKRTKPPMVDQPYNIDDEPIVISKRLIDILLEDKNRFSDLFALYCFYYYTAKWQRTSQPKATTGYTSIGIGWGRGKVILIKSKLKNLGLIEDIIQRDINGRIINHYIKVNFVFSTTLRMIPRLVKPDINALNPNKRKILFVDDDKKSTMIKYITPDMFDNFWKIYPRKDSKGSALTKWNSICRKGNKRPTWVQIKQAIIDQKKSERWSDSKYIPLSSTWLNQSRWLDDPKELKKFSRDEVFKCPQGKSFGKDFDSGRAGCQQCEDMDEKLHYRCVLAHIHKE